MNVQQDDIGLGSGDPGDSVGDRTGLTDEINEGAQLGSDAGAKHRMVIDEIHPGLLPAHSLTTLSLLWSDTLIAAC
jgi:hypothetical protein